MGDPYHPFMGKKGKPWGELDIPGIAGRVAGVEPKRPPEVDAAARAIVAACRKAGLGVEEARKAVEEAFDPVSAAPSGNNPRK